MNANLLVRELIAMGLTQMEIERRSGIDQSTVSALNTGRYGKRTPYTTVCALSNLLESVKAEAAATTTKPAQ
jgi:transcriptional regulator with XRE-family HTH domain